MAPPNTYSDQVVTQQVYDTFSPIASDALRKLILRIYDANLTDLVINKTNKDYGLLAAEKEIHQQNLTAYFDQNQNTAITGADKKVLLARYSEVHILHQKAATTPLPTHPTTNLPRLTDIPAITAPIDSTKTWAANHQKKRDDLRTHLNKKQNTDELLAIYLLFNEKSEQVAKKIELTVKQATENHTAAASVQTVIEKDVDDLFQELNTLVGTEGDNSPVSTRLSNIQTNNKKIFDILKENETLRNELDGIEADFADKQDKIAASKTVINQKISHNFSKLLAEIAVKSQEEISELEDHEEWLIFNRKYFCQPFAIFTGTTMAGALITLAFEIDNPILLVFASILSVPIFIIVAIANWYIVKNAAAEVIYNWIKNFTKEYKTPKDFAWLFLALNSTFLSVAYTYYATEIFLVELSKEIKYGDTDVKPGEEDDTGELIDETGEAVAQELPAELLEAIFWISVFGGVATGVAYFAIMQHYNKKFTFKNFMHEWNKVQNLAVVADVNWRNFIGWQVFAKILIGITLILTGVFVYAPVLMTGIALTVLGLGYILISAAHYYFSAPLRQNNTRLYVNIQMGLALFFSLTSILFLMWAALPVLITILGGSAIAAYFIVAFSFLGTAALYSFSTIKTFAKILDTNINQSLSKFNENDGGILLQQLNEDGTTKTTTTSTPTPTLTKSWVERYWELVAIFNGGSNALPSFVGAWEFGEVGVEGIWEPGAGENLNEVERGVLGGFMFAYSAGISYACNYNGIEPDLTFKGEIAYKQDTLSLINQARRHYNDVPHAIEMLEQYINDNDKNSANSTTTTATTSTAANKTLLTWWNSNPKIDACKDALEMLKSLSPGASICTKALTDEQKKLFRKDDRLFAIYTQISPYLELVQAKNKSVLVELQKLIDDLTTYENIRNSEGRFHWTGRYTGDIKPVPVEDKDSKLNAAKAFKNNLSIIYDYIDGKITTQKLEKLTPTQITSLTENGSRLDALFERAKNLLLPSCLPINVEDIYKKPTMATAI